MKQRSMEKIHRIRGVYISVEILEKRKYFDLLIAIFKIDLEGRKFGDLPFSCLITLKSIMEKKKTMLFT